jgi:ParB family transcriptional regulator, chromosome partitioning protein
MALGRGLGELLGEVESAYENNNTKDKQSVLEINVEFIDPNPYQPRKVFDEEKLQELSDSISTNGLMQPVVVTKNGDRYTLIAGERRLRATKLADITLIKAVVLEIDNNKLRELALIENIQRDDLNIMEVAHSYSGLIKDYDITHEELAKLVSKSRSSISNTLRLLTLSEYAQTMLGQDKISVGHAKIIIGLTPEKQKIVVDSIIGQKLSVRQTEELVKRLKEEPKMTSKVQEEKLQIDYKPLQEIQTKLKDHNLEVKVDKQQFKIKIHSQEDVEKILKYFQNL